MNPILTKSIKVSFISVLFLAATLYGMQHLYKIVYLYLVYKPISANVIRNDIAEIAQDVDGEYGGQEQAFRPRIIYEYYIKERKYTGDIYQAVNRGENIEWANQVIARYPVGSTVTAYYDSFDYDKSVLTKELPIEIWRRIALSLLCGTVFFVFAVKVYKSPLPAIKD